MITRSVDLRSDRNVSCQYLVRSEADLLFDQVGVDKEELDSSLAEDLFDSRPWHQAVLRH